MNFDASQQAAIDAAFNAQDCLITGGAGTGKSTLCKEIMRMKNGNADMCAPTGKAAARLKEVTDYPARTIHSFLQWDGERFRSSERITRPLIIDEASMIDSWLMAAIIERKPPQLILVGDAAQLPPVGKGQPFHDLLRLRPDITHTLDTCHRAQASVHKCANMVRRGEMPPAKDKAGGESWSLIETGNARATQARLLEWVKAGHFDPATDIILSPRHGDEDSDGDIRGINKGVMAIVNPHDPGEDWKIGDRVINGKNVGADDYWNGDTGTVTAVDADGNPWVKLDRNRIAGEVLVSGEKLKELTHAWCLSVHKAQGSQFRRVFFVCLWKHQFMLDRSLIYTAVTRAREGCCVCGEVGAFVEGIGRVKAKKTVLQALGGKLI